MQIHALRKKILQWCSLELTAFSELRVDIFRCLPFSSEVRVAKKKGEKIYESCPLQMLAVFLFLYVSSTFSFIAIFSFLWLWDNVKIIARAITVPSLWLNLYLYTGFLDINGPNLKVLKYSTWIYIWVVISWQEPWIGAVASLKLRPI